MRFMKYFRAENKNSAQSAKDRLQIIIAQQRTKNGSPDFLPLLRHDIMAVIAKHTQVDINKVQVDLQCRDNDSVLELNVVLPERVAETATDK
jgi:cell division topological specificity factor